MNSKAETSPIAIVVGLVLLLFVLIIMIVFLGDQLGGMLQGLGLFGDQAVDDLNNTAGGLFG